MGSHASMAAKLLNDESTRDVFLTMVYQLLKRDAGADLLEQLKAKNKDTMKSAEGSVTLCPPHAVYSVFGASGRAGHLFGPVHLGSGLLLQQIPHWLLIFVEAKDGFTVTA